MAQHVAVIAKNLQVHNKENVVIDQKTGASLEYRHLIKGPTKTLGKIYLQIKLADWSKELEQ